MDARERKRPAPVGWVAGADGEDGWARHEAARQRAGAIDEDRRMELHRRVQHVAAPLAQAHHALEQSPYSPEAEAIRALIVAVEGLTAVVEHLATAGFGAPPPEDQAR